MMQWEAQQADNDKAGKIEKKSDTFIIFTITSPCVLK